MRSILLAVLSAAILAAQVDTGTFSGVVTDSSGAVIPGAHVRITRQDTNVETAVITNATGFYAAPALRPGPYFLLVSRDGFRAEKRTGIELRVQDRIASAVTPSATPL